MEDSKPNIRYNQLIILGNDLETIINKHVRKYGIHVPLIAPKGSSLDILEIHNDIEEHISVFTYASKGSDDHLYTDLATRFPKFQFRWTSFDTMDCSFQQEYYAHGEEVTGAVMERFFYI